MPSTTDRAGFLPTLIAFAKEKGVVGYPGDDANLTGRYREQLLAKTNAGWFSGERPVTWGGVGHLLEFIAAGTARGLHGDAECQGGDVAGQ